MTIPIHGFRLSPQQKYLWSLYQANTVCHVQCTVLINKTLDIPLLQNALKQAIAQYEILRTTFQCPSGMKFPLQVIAQQDTFQWQVFDLSMLNAQALSIAIENRAHIDYQEPFNLALGPLLRATLLRSGPSSHILLLTLPALCMDSQSLHTLIHEISCNYNNSLLVNADDTERIQYIQFSEWQNELLDAADAEEGKAYWQRQKDLLTTPPITLPFENIRPSSRKNSYTALSTSIPSQTIAALEAVSRSCNTSLSTVLLACWQILLWQQSQEKNIIVNCMFDGRNFEELEGVIGPCTKPLPVSTHFTPDLSFNALLRQLQQTIDQINDQQEYFTWENCDTTIKPLCGFEFINRAAISDTSGVSFILMHQSTCIAPFTIKLTCTYSSTSPTAELAFDTERFHSEVIHSLLEAFATLIASVGMEPNTQVKKLNSLSSAERQRLVIDSNQTQTSYSLESSVYHLFEEQVARTPDNIAISFQQQQISYVELNKRVQQLASYLQGLGIGLEVRVGIYLKHSPELVVSILAILKAGGAYVPLETTLPAKRLQFMLEDIQAQVVFTSSELAAQLPEHSARVVCLDTDGDEITQASTYNEHLQDVSTHPSQLAYVMYTSGSTGQPKGVMISQQGLVNYLNWCIKTYANPDGHGAPVHSPNGFDLTITSLFTPLLLGQTVLLLPEEQSVEALIAALQHNAQFSLLKITPAHLELLNQQITPSQATRATRVMVIGGSVLRGESIAFWQKHGPDTRLINEYGPTETVVGCCVYEVQRDEHREGPVPIGKPVANMRLYVLDSVMQPVPVGVTGELYIGGVGIGRGYLNRPELTAAQFVPDPFSAEPGMRLYKSGDLVRYAPDGNLHFIRRIDDQVKIRGFRVEPGEIEMRLVQHPSVQEAVVTTQKDRSGEQSLVAYIVPRPKYQLLAAHLRDFLKERLPAYMIPAKFAFLSSLPLTANGKIDRSALPEPEKLQAAVDVSVITPRTEIEHTIARIWQEVLQIEQISINDNFFDRGGHSLLLVQVSSLLQEQLQREITTLEILEHPTIGALARHLSQAEAASDPLTDRSQQRLTGRGRLQQRKARIADK